MSARAKEIEEKKTEKTIGADGKAKNRTISECADNKTPITEKDDNANPKPKKKGKTNRSVTRRKNQLIDEKDYRPTNKRPSALSIRNDGGTITVGDTQTVSAHGKVAGSTRKGGKSVGKHRDTDGLMELDFRDETDMKKMLNMQSRLNKKIEEAKAISAIENTANPPTRESIDYIEMIERHYEKVISGVHKITYKKSEFQTVIEEASRIFAEESALIDVDPPCVVVGDLHGQFNDLVNMFILLGRPPHTVYVFTGDYVDRGMMSIECIMLLFCYKIAYPDNIFLLRGNHEIARVNKRYGFYDECVSSIPKYGEEIWAQFQRCFNNLPISALVATKIMCMHGGLSPSLVELNDLRSQKKPIRNPFRGLVNDMLWADPDLSVLEWKISSRGSGFAFGSNVIDDICTRLGIELIIRAHQMCFDGYWTIPGSKLITIFSAPVYCNLYKILHSTYMMRTAAGASNRLWVGPLMLVIIIALIYLLSLMPATQPMSNNVLIMPPENPQEYAMKGQIHSEIEDRGYKHISGSEVSNCINGRTNETDGTCVCLNGYNGKNCEFHICSNNGEYNSTSSRCSCRSNFYGPNCAFECHGIFNPITMKCECENNRECSRCPNGRLSDGKCVCPPGFTGPSCTICDPQSPYNCEALFKSHRAVNSRLTLSGLSFCIITVGLLCVGARRRRSQMAPMSDETWYRVFHPNNNRPFRCRHDYMCGGSWVPRDRALIVAPGRVSMSSTTTPRIHRLATPPPSYTSVDESATSDIQTLPPTYEEATRIEIVDEVMPTEVVIPEEDSNDEQKDSTSSTGEIHIQVEDDRENGEDQQENHE